MKWVMGQKEILKTIIKLNNRKITVYMQRLFFFMDWEIMLKDEIKL